MKNKISIDLIKTFATLSVIVLHVLSAKQLLAIGAPFYIWQAVPLFMMVNGINNSTSYLRNKRYKLGQLYDQNYVLTKLKKLLIPYIIVFFIELVLIVITKQESNIKEVGFRFLTGGWGPGGYFVPIILQSVLITPLIFLIIKKFKRNGLIFMFILSLVLEYLCMYFKLDNEIYRVLIIRYIFAIALGSWMTMNRVHEGKLILLAFISGIYIFLVNYKGLILLTEYTWESQHAPSYFWTMAMIVAFIKNESVGEDTYIGKTAIKISQASYHIFFAQMVYFVTLFPRLPKVNLSLQVFFSLIICVIAGVLYKKVLDLIFK